MRITKENESLLSDKLILNIKPVCCDMCDCFEGILISVAVWLETDYELMFADSWGFYKPLKKDNLLCVIGNSLNIPRDTVINNFNFYHGIETKIHDIHYEGVNLKDLISRELTKGYPIAVYINSYYIPWKMQYMLPGYKNTPRFHYCLITGMYDDKKLYCIDTLPVNNGTVIPLEAIEGQILKYVTFKKINSRYESINWRKIILNSAKKIVNSADVNNPVKLMRCFSKSILDIDLSEEIEGFINFNHAPIFYCLHKNSNTRLQFSKMLSYLFSKCNVNSLGKFVDEFEKCAKMWHIVRRMLIKSLLNIDKTGLKSTVASKVLELSALEEQLAYRLLETFSKNAEIDST